jgi:DNA-binding beta-propeller fold protein YncE
VAGACGRQRGTGYPGYALIATSGEKSVAAVDLTAFRLAKTIAVPGQPTFVTTGSAGSAFVLLADTGSIVEIGQDLAVRQTRRVADHLSQLRPVPDGKHLVAINPNGPEILLLDTATLKLQQRRRMHETLSAVDVAPSGDLVVSSGESGGVDLINLRTGEWRHTQLKSDVGSVLFRNDGKLVLASNPQERLITGLRVPDLAVLAELPLAMEPRNLCFTPDGGQLFVSGPGMDAVAIVFVYDILEIQQTVLVGRDPGVMVCSDLPGYLFVGSASGSDVSIMEVDPRKPLGAVETGQRPTYLTLTPDGQYALVLSETSGNVAVIRVGAIRANRSKTGVALFTILPVGEKPVHCGFVPRPLV